MKAGIRPGEFWDLTLAEYNLIVEAYQEAQKERLYHDIRNAYYTGCFAQVEKPNEFYKSVIDSLESKPQTGAEMFSFLQSLGSERVRGDVLASRFHIPLKLTPEFDVSVFRYIHRMGEDTLELYLPNVALSLDGEILKPSQGVYTLTPGLVKIKYNAQVYTIVMIRVGRRYGS